MIENKSLNSKEVQEEINIRQVFEQYAYYWKWFVLSVLIALGAAVLCAKGV